jgi:hypothetical protein
MFANARQIVEYSTSKTGKHGHAKAKFSALDIFTGRRHEGTMPTSHNVEAPVGALARGGCCRDFVNARIVRTSAMEQGRASSGAC